MRPWSSEEECISLKDTTGDQNTDETTSGNESTIRNSTPHTPRKESPTSESLPNSDPHEEGYLDILGHKIGAAVNSAERTHNPSLSEPHRHHGHPSSPTPQALKMSASAMSHPFIPISSPMAYTLHGSKTPPQNLRVSPHPHLSPPCPRLAPFHQWNPPSFYPGYSPISDMFFRHSFPQHHQQLLQLSAPRMLSRSGAPNSSMLEDSKDLILSSSIESLRLRARHHAACLGLLNNSPRT